MATFKATVERRGWTWGNARRRDGQTWEAVIAVPDFKTVNKICHGNHGTDKKPLAGGSETG